MKKPDLSFDALEPFFDKIEKLPRMYRLLISAGIFLLFIGAAIWLLYMPKYETIGKLETDLSKLQKELETAKRNAKDLKKFQQKMQDAEEQFKIVMKSLPEKEEIPSLLTSISDSGKDSGLEFLLFQPKGEVKKDFYAEIPVAIKVNGNYHNLAIFFDRVARLSRVVNIRDISISPGKGSEELVADCTAVTYKFIESEPQPQKGKGNKKSSRKSRKK
jgi:type IV pilus assembly protein PilO